MKDKKIHYKTVSKETSNKWDVWVIACGLPYWKFSKNTTNEKRKVTCGNCKRSKLFKD